MVSWDVSLSLKRLHQIAPQTFVRDKAVSLAGGSLHTLEEVPASAGGALDVMVSFDLSTMDSGKR
jgi:hypothetical protein